MDSRANRPAADLEPGVDSREQLQLAELLAWLGDGKRWIGLAGAGAAIVAAAVALWLPDVYTARASLLAPNSQQQSGSAAAIAALGSLGALPGSLAPKSPDELYVGLLRSDSVQRALDGRFGLKQRWKAKNYEQLRKTFLQYVRIAADKKSGLISVDVDDEDPKFAANLANAYSDEVTRLLGRLAVGEAQQRRVFFEQQLKETKERLVQAEQDLRGVQEKSGMIVLDKQAEALINSASTLRAQITEREVRLKVLRTGATEQNPDVQRLGSELAGLRAELARMESRQGNAGSAIDMPVGRIPEASIDYIRAQRELKLEEALLEAMVRQYEAAKLDEAKEGPALQRVDLAEPPDHKAKPQRALIVGASTLLALVLASAFVIARRYLALSRVGQAASIEAWEVARRAWRWRR